MEAVLDAEKLKTTRRVLLADPEANDDPIEEIPSEVLDHHRNLITVHLSMKKVLRQLKLGQEEI